MKTKKWKIEEKMVEHKKYYAVYEILDNADEGNFIKYYQDIFSKLQDAIDYIKNRNEEIK